ILNLFEQFAVVVEKAGNALLEDQFLHDSYSEVSFTNPDRANQQKSRALDRVLLDEHANLEQGLLLRGVCALIACIELCKFAVLVALRNSTGREQGMRAGLQTAMAAGNPWLALRGYRLPSCTLANGTNIRRHLHGLANLLLSLDSAPSAGDCASGKAGAAVYIL